MQPTLRALSTNHLFLILTVWYLVFTTIDRWFMNAISIQSQYIMYISNCCISHFIYNIIIDVALQSQILSAAFFAGSSPGIAAYACGSVDSFSSYTKIYSISRTFIQALCNCLIPITLMLIGSLDIRRVIH
ncbi:unnamed protein product [Adineta ricciae]|uniref:Uncharacterized protein n=1 Tax=Adineta ricciae TaxID=249248 RepID=A0A813ULC6_ADIRI|nr:unnamed protein product [Adineta ricciae]